VLMRDYFVEQPTYHVNFFSPSLSNASKYFFLLLIAKILYELFNSSFLIVDFIFHRIDSTS